MLEARFHPRQRGDEAFVVVGHLVWRGRGARRPPTVRLAESTLLGATRSAVLSKLHYLIGVTAPESFERLQALRSRFWSFVDVSY